MTWIPHWFTTQNSLKIRGKLILSFSVVMVVLLSALGSITYLTFKDSISSSKNHVAELTLKTHSLSFTVFFQELSENLLHLTSSAQTTEIATDSNAIARAISSKVQDNPYISSSVITSNGTILHGPLNGETSALLDSLELANTSIYKNFIFSQNNTWIRSKLPLKNEVLLEVYFLLNMKNIWTSILKSNHRENSSLFFVSNRNGMILSHVESTKDADNQIDKDLISITKSPTTLNTIVNAASAQDGQMVQLDDNHIVSNTLNLLDWTMVSVLPHAVYINDLIKLKNRIITATIIIFWFSLWVVLIVAHQISKPIIKLSEATLNIQKHHYSTPLNTTKRNDEIGDLADSFESMRQQIEKLIFNDTLTGIRNRRYLLQAMGSHTSKAMCTDNPLSFIMIDLDHFKAVNDNHGHGAGDEVLKVAAKAIAENVRDGDIPARYGGEEFCVLLPKAEAADALEVAERIRRAVEALRIDYDDKTLTITCSLGIADLANVNNYKESTEEDAINSLMGQADLALYSAKNSGRNQCMIYAVDMNMGRKAA